MPSIPVFHCEINTDNVTFIGDLLEKEKFLKQNSSLTFMKSNSDYNIQIDLSQSFESPSIVCCCSTIAMSLARLLSFLKPNSGLINLIVFVQPSDLIDWNPLICLVNIYNLSLNIVNNENEFSKKLDDIINNLVNQNLKKKPVLIHMNKNNSIEDIQVKF